VMIEDNGEDCPSRPTILGVMGGQRHPGHQTESGSFADCVPRTDTPGRFLHRPDAGWTGATAEGVAE